MIVLIDNYDSFTYNLYQYAGEINPDIKVVRNDKVDVDDIGGMAPSHIIVSPGPGFPRGAGISIEVIRKLGPTIPTLGICLGHQAIGESFGGKVVHAPCGPVHGKRSDTHIATGCPVFLGLPPVMGVGRYHSLVVERESLPDDLLITAETGDGLIMGLAHRNYPVFGIQFHPESVLTDMGKQIIRNFLAIGQGDAKEAISA